MSRSGLIGTLAAAGLLAACGEGRDDAERAADEAAEAARETWRESADERDRLGEEAEQAAESASRHIREEWEAAREDREALLGAAADHADAAAEAVEEGVDAAADAYADALDDDGTAGTGEAAARTTEPAPGDPARIDDSAVRPCPPHDPAPCPPQSEGTGEAGPAPD